MSAERSYWNFKGKLFIQRIKQHHVLYVPRNQMVMIKNKRRETWNKAWDDVSQHTGISCKFILLNIILHFDSK